MTTERLLVGAAKVDITPDYNELFFRAVLAGVAQARDAMIPATARYARTLDGHCAFNRRFIMRDGTAKTHPGYCNGDVLHVEGPVDPGAWSETVSQKLGGDCVVGCLNGACGNTVHPCLRSWRHHPCNLRCAPRLTTRFLSSRSCR